MVEEIVWRMAAVIYEIGQKELRRFAVEHEVNIKNMHPPFVDNVINPSKKYRPYVDIIQCSCNRKDKSEITWKIKRISAYAMH